MNKIDYKKYGKIGTVTNEITFPFLFTGYYPEQFYALAQAFCLSMNTDKISFHEEKITDNLYAAIFFFDNQKDEALKLFKKFVESKEYGHT